MREQYQCHERSRDRSRRIERLNQPVGGPQPFLPDRLGNHHVTRSSTHALSETVREANHQNVPPSRNHRQQRLDYIRNKISGDDEWLTSIETVGKISGE